MSNVPHLRDVTTMLNLLGRMGVAICVDERTGVEFEGRGSHEPGRTLRSRENHARFGSDAGAARGTVWAGACFPAGRVRDRLASGGSAHQRSRGDGRRDPHRAGRRHRARTEAQWRSHPLRPRDGHGHRESHDGRDARRRDDHPRERRARTRSRRSRTVSRRHGRAHSRRRHIDYRDRRRRASARRTARGDAGPHRNRHLSRGRGRDAWRHPPHANACRHSRGRDRQAPRVRREHRSERRARFV